MLVGLDSSLELVDDDVNVVVVFVVVVVVVVVVCFLSAVTITN